MKWAITAAALVVVANGVVLVSEQRERRAAATITAINVCSSNLVGGGSSDDPPAIRLMLGYDSSTATRGLDAAGLRALGFSDANVMAAGRPRDSTFRWPAGRPGWVRLRQMGDSLGSFVVIEMASRRDQLTADSTSLIVRGLVTLRERSVAPPPDAAASGAKHDHAAMTHAPAPGLIYPTVSEVIPSLLHLDREQIVQLRAGLPDSVSCSAKRRALIANGVAGGIWVERVE